MFPIHLYFGCVLAALAGFLSVAVGAGLPTGSFVHEPGRTKAGIDVLAMQDFEPLRGKRVGLITNHTGVGSEGRCTIDVLAHAKRVELVALFSPEHSILGRAEAPVASAKDTGTGLPI